MPRVNKSPQARADAKAIWRYIARDNPAAATRMLHRFDEQVRKVADIPNAGRPRDDLAPGVRSIPLGSYLLFYRPIKGGIELVRILHGARDIHRRMFEEQ